MIERVKPGYLLLAMFFVSALVRSLLAFATSAGPTVTIDEGLYINIARGLFYEGSVLYRAQPVEYVYLLYPIFLLPTFLLPAQVNLYRAIQVWNVLLMSGMVFPAYLLCKGLKLKRSQSYFVVAATLLIPEIMLSSNLVSESLIYPMMLWTFLLAQKVLASPKKSLRFIALGLLSGLSYFAKPECVIFGLCFFAVMLARAARARDRSGVFRALLGASCVGMIILLGYLAYRGMFGAASVMNLYEKQIPDTSWRTVLIMLQGSVYHMIAVLLCGGGAFTFLPVLCRDRLGEQTRPLLSGIALSLLVTVLGIGVFIVPYRYTGTWLACAVHTRYLMYFLPVLLAMLFSPELSDCRLTKGQMLILCGVTALYVFPSAFNLFTTQAGVFDSPSLNMFFANRAGYGAGILLILGILCVTAYLLYMLRTTGWNARVRTIACWLCALFLVCNGAMAYANLRPINRNIETGAAEAARALAEKEYVIATNNTYDDLRGFQLDAHLRKPAKMVVFNNLMLDAVQTGGVYRPFAPLVQAPNTMSVPTPDTDTLLFDITVADYIEFSDSVALEELADGLYTVATLTPGERYVKSALTHMNGYVLQGGETGSLLVFDEAMLARGSVTLNISLYGYSPCDVVFASGSESVTVRVSTQSETFTVTLPMTQNGFYQFTITPSADIVVNEYSTL